MLDAVSQLGILLLLLLTGMETDLSVVRDARRTAFSISLDGIRFPSPAASRSASCCRIPAARSGKRLITTLFLGTALSISSVKIVALVVRELGFLRRTVGQVIVASAIIDDTVGWIIMSVTFGLALHGGIDLPIVARSVLGTAVFLALSFTVGRRMVFLLIRWANDRFVTRTGRHHGDPGVAGLMALVTNAIGVHMVLGAFVGGHPHRPVAHPDAAHRRAAARLDRRTVHAGVLRTGRTHDRSGRSRETGHAAAHRWADRDRQPRKVCGRFLGGRIGGLNFARIAGGRLRHECPRLDGGHRRHLRAVDGRAESEPVHVHRRHGGRDHDGDAADVALGVAALADGAARRRARLEREEFEAQGFVRTSSGCSSRWTRAPADSWPRGWWAALRSAADSDDRPAFRRCHPRSQCGLHKAAHRRTD